MSKTRILPLWLSAAVLVAGVLATAGYWDHLRTRERAAVAHEFTDTAAQMVTAIERQLHTFTVVMRGLQGFFHSSELVNQAELQRYFAALEVTNELAGVQALSYVEWLPAAELVAHEAAVRAELGAAYRVHPQPPGEWVAPIKYLFPATGDNRKALGFDILTNPSAREAAERSRDLGRVVITRPLTLIQDEGLEGVRSFVMYLPVYEGGVRPQSVAERRRRLQGWVDVPFRMRDFLAGLGDTLEPTIDLEINDGGLSGAAAELFDADAVSAAEREEAGELVYRSSMSFGDREWRLSLASTPEYRSKVAHPEQSTAIALSGIALSVLLAVLVYRIARGRDESERRAARLGHLYHALSEINQAIVRIEREDGLFALVCRLAVRDGEMRKAWVGTVDETGEWLDVVAQFPDGGSPGVGERIRVEGGMARVLREREAGSEPVDRELGSRVIREVLPILRGGQVFALLVVHHEGVGALDEEVNALLREVASDLGFALDNFDREEARAASERALVESRQRLASVLENVGAGVYTKDLEGRFTYVNQQAADMLGLSEREILGKTDRHFFGPETVERSAERERRVLEQQERIETESEETLLESGERRVYWSVKIPLYDAQGEVYGLCGISTDLTEQKASVERLRYLEDYDELTDLPNRHLLEQRLEASLEFARDADGPLAVIAIDLDQFRLVNESFGLRSGDEVLRSTARRLARALGPGALLGRLGADQFCLLVPGMTSEEAAAWAVDLGGRVAEPLTIGEKELSLTASMGVAAYPLQATTAETLLQAATGALSMAKQRGGASVVVYEERQRMESQDMLQLRHDLRLALERGELLLHYQPQVDIASGSVVGAEALLRWRHPTRGMIPPDQFIYLAEEIGLIVEIGSWVMRSVAHQQAEWERAGLHLASVAVNLSAVQVWEEDFYDIVAQVVAESGLRPGQFELELTERIAMQHTLRSVRVLHQLRDLGVSLSIDDFGTGYSSLSYIKRFPVNKLKIDKSFIQSLVSDPEDAAIVRAVVALARGLGCSTVAEGVETAEQLAFLRAIGCDAYQGYLFSRPLPAEEFAQLLAVERYR